MEKKYFLRVIDKNRSDELVSTIETDRLESILECVEELKMTSQKTKLEKA